MKTSTKIWMCLGGCALVVLGVLCIANPGSTILSLAWALGLMLLIAGFSTIGVWSTMRDEDPYSGLTFLGALLQIFLGTWMVINPAPLAVTLPFIFAFWVRVAAVNRVQKKMHRIADHIRKVVDIEDVEEVK